MSLCVCATGYELQMQLFIYWLSSNIIFQHFEQARTALCWRNVSITFK